MWADEKQLWRIDVWQCTFLCCVPWQKVIYGRLVTMPFGGVCSDERSFMDEMMHFIDQCVLIESTLWRHVHTYRRVCNITTIVIFRCLLIITWKLLLSIEIYIDDGKKGEMRNVYSLNIWEHDTWNIFFKIKHN